MKSLKSFISLLVVASLILVVGSSHLPDAESWWQPPYRPTNLTATPGENSVTLTWTAPSQGSSPIKDYHIYYHDKPDNSLYSVHWIKFPDGESTKTSVTVTGLKDGTYYKFRLAASNSQGLGYSARTSATAGIPETPTSLQATPGNAQVTLTWTAPNYGGGSAISDYIIQYRTGNNTFTEFADGKSTGTTATITGLSNGTSYEFKVATRNQVNTGNWSTSVYATPGTPTSSTSFVATAKDKQVQLVWNVPPNGGSAITDYIVEYKETSGVQWIKFDDDTRLDTDTIANVTGLTNGTSYSFRVAAVNSVGMGLWSDIVSAIPAAVPGAPLDLKTNSGRLGSTLHWTEPNDVGGSSIVNYIVQYKRSDTSNWSQIVRNPLLVDTFLPLNTDHIFQVGTSYDFRVAAVNTASQGPWSDIFTVKIPDTLLDG